jgi:hypothetical protein
MENSPAFEEHPVEQFLGAPGPDAVSEKFRPSLLAQTTGLLRRRRRLRRTGYIAGLVSCYLFGVGTMLLVARPTLDVPAAVEPKSSQAVVASRPPQTVLPPDRDPEIPPFVLERMGQSCEENRSRLYRQAGDQYLADGDYESAVHCYSRSLDAGSEKDLTVSTDDNWLLIQLKIARQEDKVNAKSAG